MRRRIAGRIAVVALVACALVAGCSDDHRPKAAEPTLEQDIAAYLDISAQMALLRALVVVHDGKTVLEKYPESNASEYHDTESVTKSVIGTLIGIALDEGSLRDTNQTLAELLPSYAASMTLPVARTTLGQILSMTAGFSDVYENDLPTFLRAEDAVAAILEGGVRSTGFQYSNAGAHLLSAILSEATGMSTLEYARTRLFDPIGIDSSPAAEPLIDPAEIPAYNRADFAWPVDQQGRNNGFGYVKLRARDLARLGQLYLDEGRWQGEQVVSASWVHDTTSPHAKVDATTNYGYLWWIDQADGDPAYAAVGTGGQVIRVIPDRDLVIVVACEYHLLDMLAPEVDPESALFLADEVVAPHFAK